MTATGISRLFLLSLIVTVVEPVLKDVSVTRFSATLTRTIEVSPDSAEMLPEALETVRTAVEPTLMLTEEGETCSDDLVRVL